MAYKVWATGATTAHHGGVRTVPVGVTTIAKRGTDELPYTVANEWICNRLAGALLLPCSPGMLIDRDGETWFASLHFLGEPAEPPPARPARLVAEHPSLSTGITLFDIWVLNQDRHRGNIAMDTTGEAPPHQRVHIFDHESALVRGRHGLQEQRRYQDGLGVGEHCLLNVLDTWDHVPLWTERIQAIPSFFITGLFDAVVEEALMEAEVATQCVTFLLDRQRRLPDLLYTRRARFGKLNPDAFPEALRGQT